MILAVVLAAGEAESNVEAKDVSIGLLAIGVYGVLYPLSLDRR